MSADARIIPLHLADARRRRVELEFLPAALEIVETPPSPVGRAIGASIVGFFGIAIAWSWFGTIDIIATAPGRFVPTGRTKVIQPFETGVVRAIRVKDGMAVKAGDILIEIDPTASEADERRLAYNLVQDRLDIARLTALLAGDPAVFMPPADADARKLSRSTQAHGCPNLDKGLMSPLPSTTLAELDWWSPDGPSAVGANLCS